jgi:hypothetical protein
MRGTFIYASIDRMDLQISILASLQTKSPRPHPAVTCGSGSPLSCRFLYLLRRGSSAKAEATPTVTGGTLDLKTPLSCRFFTSRGNPVT